MSEPIRDPLNELGVLGRVLGDIRQRLKEGGPDVNHAALHAYRAGVLVEEERRLVAQRIATWQRWHQAYWELCAAIDSEALETVTAPEEDSTPPGEDSVDIRTGRATADNSAGVWLAATLARPMPAVATAEAWAVFLATALSARIALRLSGRFNRDKTKPVHESKEVLNELEDQIARGDPILFQDQERWLYVTVQRGQVQLRAGLSPAESFTDFCVEFRRAQDVIVSLATQDGLIQMTPADFDAAVKGQADRLVILGK